MSHHNCEYGKFLCYRFSLPAYLAAIALIVGHSSSPTQAATIIDFDSLTSSSAIFLDVPSPYEEDGVRFTTESPVNSMSVFLPAHPKSIGSPYLVPLESITYVVSSVDSTLGIAFEAATLVDVFFTTPTTITFHGTRFDGSVVTESITTEGDADVLSDGGVPEDYAFSLLSAGVYESIAFSGEALQFGVDDLHVRLMPVPEPNTGLAALGLLGAMLLYSSRRSVA